MMLILCIAMHNGLQMSFVTGQKQVPFLAVSWCVQLTDIHHSVSVRTNVQQCGDQQETVLAFLSVAETSAPP